MFTRSYCTYFNPYFLFNRGPEGEPKACHRAVQQGHPPGQHRAGDGAPVRAQGGRHGSDHRQQQVRHRHQPAGHADDVKKIGGFFCQEIRMQFVEILEIIVKFLEQNC